MSKRATITIELNYVLEDLEFMTGESISEDEFLQTIEEYALHDLTDLMRGDSISSWADIKIEDEE